VHLRRAILLFALVLGLTALAAAVSPSRDEDPTTPEVAPGTQPAPVAPRTLAFAERPTGRHVLAPEAGRYDLMLEPSGGPGEPRRVGTLVTRP
jgi:hypothetical protein